MEELEGSQTMQVLQGIDRLTGCCKKTTEGERGRKIQFGKASHSVFITTIVGNCVMNLFSLHTNMPENSSTG